MEQFDFHPLTEFYEALDQWARNISRITEVVDGPRKAFAKFAERNAELLKALRSIDVVLPALVEDMLSPMVALGWYPDLEMPFANLSKVVDSFKTDPAPAEKEYAEFLASELPTAQERLTLQCPAREQPFKDGFDAHKKGLYFSSTPVFLAQAEGLAWERLGVALYSRKRLRKRVTELEAEGWSMSDILLRPLLESTDMNKTENERPKGFSGLNRHAVFHGKDITYGTERNSLKAVSHLLFVSDVLKHVNKES